MFSSSYLILCNIVILQGKSQRKVLGNTTDFQKNM